MRALPLKQHPAESWIAELLESARRAYASGDAAAARDILDQISERAILGKHFVKIANLHRRFGRMELAAAASRRALERDPASVDAHLLLADLRAPVHGSDDIAALVRLYDNPARPEARIRLGFALGKIFEDIQQYDRAFLYYQEANSSRRAGIDYSNDVPAAWLKHYTSIFSRRTFERFPSGSLTGEAPIFIVGMPRSGSTLVEQILASHPLVFAGGETNLLPKIVSRALQDSNSPSLRELLKKARSSWWPAMAKIYLDTVNTARGHRKLATDKTLYNFWRVGLIRLMFPSAKIVHCVRDPLDNCFSIYRRNFSDSNIIYGYDLDELGVYYKNYESMMRHWDGVLPGFVYRHSYEELIGDLEGSARRLLQFCGLEWDDRCLEFYKAERGVMTTSVTQVRKPLYSDALGSAEPFRSHLGPLIAALEARL